MKIVFFSLSGSLNLISFKVVSFSFLKSDRSRPPETILKFIFFEELFLVVALTLYDP